MVAFRLIASLLCAYITAVGLGVLTGLDSRVLMGPAGSVTHRAISPQLERYLELTNPLVGATGLIVIGVVALVLVWRGAFKRPTKKQARRAH